MSNTTTDDQPTSSKQLSSQASGISFPPPYSFLCLTSDTTTPAKMEPAPAPPNQNDTTSTSISEKTKISNLEAKVSSQAEQLNSAH